MFLKVCLKLGEKQQMWLKRLKIAVVQKDTKELEHLLDNIPKLTEKKEIDEGLCLLDAAKNIVEELQEEDATTMLQMRRNLDFLRSTQTNKSVKFDVTF